MRNFLVVLILLLVTFSCKEEKSEVEFKEYEGPLMELKNVRMLFSDSAMVKIMMKAPLQQELQNGDQEFAEGIYIEFYDDDNEVYATIKANKAYYIKEEDKYRGREDVVVQNFKEEQKLNTEELFWDPKEQNIYTEKFVIITTPEDVISGEGLEAKQDFSYYEIKKPNIDKLIEDEDN